MDNDSETRRNAAAKWHGLRYKNYDCARKQRKYVKDEVKVKVSGEKDESYEFTRITRLKVKRTRFNKEVKTKMKMKMKICISLY